MGYNGDQITATRMATGTISATHIRANTIQTFQLDATLRRLGGSDIEKPTITHNSKSNCVYCGKTLRFDKDLCSYCGAPIKNLEDLVK